MRWFRGAALAASCGLVASLLAAAPVVDEGSFHFEGVGAGRRLVVDVRHPGVDTCRAQLRLEWVSAEGHVRARGGRQVTVHPGRNSYSVPFGLRSVENGLFPVRVWTWDRLRYELEPRSCPGWETQRGLTSISRTRNDFFALEVPRSWGVTAGGAASIPLRAVDPVTGAGIAGIEVAVELSSRRLGGIARTAELITDETGLAIFTFAAPEKGQELNLKATATRGGLVQRDETRIQIERQGRTLIETDKEIYQPGQTARIRGIGLSNGGVAAGEDVLLTVWGQEGSELERALEANAFGVFAVDWPIPEDAQLGDYRIVVTIGGGEYGWEDKQIRVSRYELPEFTVKSEWDQPFAVEGETRRLTVATHFFAGPPVRGAEVRVEEGETYWEAGGQSGEEPESPFVANAVAGGDGTAEVSVMVGPIGDDRPGALREYSVVVTDPATLRQAREVLTIPVGRQPVEIELIHGPGLSLEIPDPVLLRASYPGGAPAKGRFVVRSDSAEGREIWRGTTDDFGIASTDSLRLLRAIGPGGDREAVLQVEFEDGEGRRSEWTRRLRLSGEPALRLLASKTLLGKDEPVELTVLSSERSGHVAVAAYAGRGLAMAKTVELVNGVGRVSLVGFARWEGLVHLVAEQPLAGLMEPLLASTKVLFPVRQELAVDVRFGADSYEPGDTASARVEVRGMDGKPAEAAVGLWAVDEAVLARAAEDERSRRAATWLRPDSKLEQGLWSSDPDESEQALAAALAMRDQDYRWSPRLLNDHSRGNHFYRYENRMRKDLAWAQEQIDAALEHADDDPVAFADEAWVSRELPELADQRDPWGQPYEFRFRLVVPMQHLDAVSAGPDESMGTADDLTVDVAGWRFFAGMRRKVADAVFAQGSFPWDLRAYDAALAAAGLDREKMLDPWGQPYRVRFGLERRLAPGPVAYWYAQGQGRRGEPVFADSELAYPAIWLECPMSPGPAKGRTVTVAKMVSAEAVGTTPAGPRRPAEPSGRDAVVSGIDGVVVDATGAVIPASRVEVTDPQTGRRWLETADEFGQYLVSDLPEGPFDVRVELEGFRTTLVLGVPVSERFVTRLDVQLDVGSVTETVEVTSAPLMLQTSTASMMTAVAAVPSAPRIRRDFVETLLWQPLLETGADGVARVEFPVSDNITTWRVLATASTKDGRLRQEEAALQVIQPLYMDFTPPTVLTEGDEVEAPVRIHNYMDGDTQLDLSVKTDETEGLEAAATVRVVVPAGETRLEPVMLRAEGLWSEHTVRVSALGARRSDAVEKTVAVRPDGESRPLAVSELLSAGDVLEFAPDGEMIPGSVRAELVVYPNAVSQAFAAIDGLLRRPYGCGEQTISSTYPNVMILSFLSRTGLEREQLAATARRNAVNGYQRLLRFQDPSGGFRYFRRDEEPNLALTAYALEFLSEAQGHIEVDPSVAQRARNWLEAALKAADGKTVDSYFAAATLAERGGEAPPLAGELPVNSYALANWLRIAVAQDDRAAGKPAIAALVDRGTWWNWESKTPFYGGGLAGDAETTATVLGALLAAESSGLQVPRSAIRSAAAHLLSLKDQNSVWWSTQATVRALAALLALDGDVRGQPAPKAIMLNGETIRLPESGGPLQPLQVDVAAKVRNGLNQISLPNGTKGTVSVQIAGESVVRWGAKPRTLAGVEFAVAYGAREVPAGEPVRVDFRLESERSGYGLWMAEVGLPPGAEVDRDSLDRLVAGAGSKIRQYDVLPDRVVLYLARGAKTVDASFRFRPRLRMKALTAPSSVWSYYDPETVAKLAPVRFVVK